MSRGASILFVCCVLTAVRLQPVVAQVGAATLAEAAGAVVLSYVDTMAMDRRDITTTWYWTFSLDALGDEQVARELAEQIRSRLPQSASDTVTARERLLIHVYAPELYGDSARVRITYVDSSEFPCNWLHTSVSFEHRFVQEGGRWVHRGHSGAVIGDAAPPPPEGVMVPCRGRAYRDW